MRQHTLHRSAPFAACVSLILAVLAAGCASTRPATQPAVVERWEHGSRPTGRGRLEFADTSTRVIDRQHLRVSSRILCSYEVAHTRRRAGTAYVEQTGLSWEPWIPTNICLRTVYGQQSCTVNNIGQFAFTVVAPDDAYEYFQAPPPKQNQIIRKALRSIEVRVLDPPALSLASPQALLNVSVWLYEPVVPTPLDLPSAVDEFRAERVSTIILAFKDFRTRVPITPTVDITPVSVPSLQALIDHTRQRGYGRSESNEIVQSALSDVLVDGRHAEVSQTIVFKALRGGVYRIRASHGNSYAFSGVLQVGLDPQIAKTVLMVPTGQKLETDTGAAEGGVIVDE
jgi:hypothetical protein